MMTSLLIFIALLAFLGLPLFVTLFAITLVSFTFLEIDSSAISIAMYQISSLPILMTIPLFTFAGQVVAESRSPERIMRMARAIFGHFPGGVAIVSLFVCAIFTAFTGASGITIIALGGLLFPVLTRNGEYSDRFTLGLISTSGSLGLLFPPSLPVILYGLVSKVDINKLYKAGVIPCLLLIVTLSIYAVFKQQKFEKRPFVWTEVWSSLREGILELILPFMVLVGIYGGYTTAQEASAFTALYVVVVAFLIHRDLHVSDIGRIVKKTMSLVGAILLIFCCSMAFTDLIVDEEVPQKILNTMRLYITNKYVFLIFLNIFLLVAGSVMDIFGAIIVIVQLVIPIAAEYGVHPIHFAIIFLTNLEIGYIFPPFGINLFLSCFRLKKPLGEVYASVWPFLFYLFVALMVITYVPSLSLMLVE